MATSIRPSRGWHQDFTVFWSQLYTLYSREIFWENQLCDIGYYGYPDPRYTQDDRELAPDLTAFHTQGDSHHVSIQCFESLKDNKGSYISDREDHVEAKIAQLAEFHQITPVAVSEWLEARDHDFTPSHQEVVVLIPASIYKIYSQKINTIASDNDLIIWTIEPNGTSFIKKRCGSHSNRRLEDAITDGLNAYHSADDLLQYSRKTDVDYLKFEFIHKLVNHCARENKLEFSFTEVDDIMTESQPPILGHLPRETRESEFWQKFLYSMLKRFKIIEQGDMQSTYRWKRKKFLNEPRYQSTILENVRSELGIGENA